MLLLCETDLFASFQNGSVGPGSYTQTASFTITNNIPTVGGTGGILRTIDLAGCNIAFQNIIGSGNQFQITSSGSSPASINLENANVRSIFDVSNPGGATISVVVGSGTKFMPQSRIVLGSSSALVCTNTDAIIESIVEVKGPAIFDVENSRSMTIAGSEFLHNDEISLTSTGNTIFSASAKGIGGLINLAPGTLVVGKSGCLGVGAINVSNSLTMLAAAESKLRNPIVVASGQTLSIMTNTASLTLEGGWVGLET